MNEEQIALDGMPEPVDLRERKRLIDDEWIEALLNDPDARAEDLLAAFQAPDVDPRRRDATLLHPSLAGLDLAGAIGDWPESLRDRAVSVTDNRAVLEVWSNSPIPYERAIVAMNPHCPCDLALTLARDAQPAVRANAVCCPQLPRSERAGIANRDPDPDVRDFARWIMRTLEGADFVAGHRYAQAPGEPAGTVARVVSYGINRQVPPPV